MSHANRRLTVVDLILLIGGLAVGLWLGIETLGREPPDRVEKALAFLAFVLGGVSLIGPPLLLRERFRRRTRLRHGELFWFCQGTAAWLLWPPTVLHRIQAKEGEPGGMTTVCYVYGTPLMALYVAIALLAGGWLPLRPRRSRRSARPWTDTLGLVLGLIWACTGVYVLVLIYRRDLFR